MSNKEKQIQKNLKLSAAFSEYIVSHPEFIEDIPDNVEIIFSDKNDPTLKKRNLDLIHGSRKNVYEAERRGANWKISPLVK